MPPNNFSEPIPVREFHAAGDQSATASTDNSAVTPAMLASFLRNHATGSLAPTATSVPTGVYIPVDNSTSLAPMGGIYVEGDARIVLDVVHGQSQFAAPQWNQIQSDHRGCKFQKIKVDPVTSGIPTRDIFVGDEPCRVTYVFNADNSAQAPSVLRGRVNGNLHVNGKIDELGGASRTRPAIATDFGYTISATKDIRVISDIQYEDVVYKTFDPDTGATGGTEVANAYGSLNNSGIQPTAENIAPMIDHDSKTVLGLLSTQRNVLVHTNAPPNINLHAAVYAGNSNPYNSSTGYGCGASGANTQGCGFGFEAWNSRTGMGSLKLLGGISEYKDQTTGQLSNPPRGYESRFIYDTRLRMDLTPPAFPLSDAPQVFGSVRPIRTFRLASSEAN